jgi:hypothetical protein
MRWAAAAVFRRGRRPVPGGGNLLAGVRVHPDNLEP